MKDFNDLVVANAVGSDKVLRNKRVYYNYGNNMGVTGLRYGNRYYP
jgi:hypothetical protein